MFPLTRILSLAAAGALVALTAASIPARAGDSAQALRSAEPHEFTFTECQALRRAISRRACQARLWREEHIDTAREDSQRNEPLSAED
jgi:hypothetical protein